MDFTNWLVSKKINPSAFKAAEPARYAEWDHEFSILSPTSFQQQKLFLINPIRRRYTLPPEQSGPAEAKAAGGKPKIPRPGAVTKPKKTETEATPASQSAKAKAVFRPKIKAKAAAAKPEGEKAEQAANRKTKPQIKPRITK